MMTKSERTRQHILEATAMVFNTKGFDSAALSDLCEATQLTKGALYGHFENKEELAVASFHYMMKKVKTLVRAEMKDASTPYEKLLALLHFYAKYVYQPPVPGGCPLLNTAVQMDDDLSNPLRRLVAKELKQTVQFMADLIEEGQQQGVFKKSINAMQYAYLFFCAMEGAIMVSRVSPHDESMQNVVALCEQLLTTIRTNK